MPDAQPQNQGLCFLPVTKRSVTANTFYFRKQPGRTLLLAITVLLTFLPFADGPCADISPPTTKPPTFRKTGLLKGGGTETAVVKSLRWLKEHQNPDGSWSQTQPVAMCGLALLCYLSHGELANSKEFGPTVEKAMQYLVKAMNDADRYVRGSCGYPHAIATYALAEAYGMTKLPMFKEPMEKGLAVIINGQQDGGGFNYNFDKSGRWDLSISGWNILAMKAGDISGSSNPKIREALHKSRDFLKKTAYANGRFGYSQPGIEKDNYHMTAIGTHCLQILGEKDSAEVKEAINTIAQNVKVAWADPNRKQTSVVSFECYGWYFCTQAMFYRGGQAWQEWYKMYSREICQGQKADGHWDAPPVAFGGKIDVGEMEPYYATTLCNLMLSNLPNFGRRMATSFGMELDAQGELKTNHHNGVSTLEIE